jgi:YidC/Oxa1 family membrane protein insertase
MPIWFALYKMLSVAGELKSAIFVPGWLDDLTVRDPFFILPVALTGLMFLQSKVQPPAGDSMQQKMLMYGLPLMFGVMGLYFPSGLGVYMLTNSALSIAHSLYMKRTDPAPGTKAAATKTETKSEAKSETKSETKSEEPGVEDDSEDDLEAEPAPAKGQTSAKNPQGGQGQGQRRGKRRGKKR